jgi:hypothetical protein
VALVALLFVESDEERMKVGELVTCQNDSRDGAMDDSSVVVRMKCNHTSSIYG